MVPEAYQLARSVLESGTMSRTALALVMLAATAPAASAGGFVGLGIGTSPAVSNDTPLEFEEDGRSARLQLGYRFGHFSIEGHYAGAGLFTQNGQPYDWSTIGIAGRINFELGDRFELFGRLGLQQTDLVHVNGEWDYTGRGLFGSAGIEYRLTVGGVGLGAFIDYTIAQADMTTPARAGGPWGTTSRLWTLGGLVYF